MDSPQAASSHGGHPSGAERLIRNVRREEPPEKSPVCHVLAVWIWLFFLSPMSTTSGTDTEEGKWSVLVSRRRFPGGGSPLAPAEFLQRTQPILFESPEALLSPWTLNRCNTVEIGSCRKRQCFEADESLARRRVEHGGLPLIVINGVVSRQSEMWRHLSVTKRVLKNMCAIYYATCHRVLVFVHVTCLK